MFLFGRPLNQHSSTYFACLPSKLFRGGNSQVLTKTLGPLALQLVPPCDGREGLRLQDTFPMGPQEVEATSLPCVRCDEISSKSRSKSREPLLSASQARTLEYLGGTWNTWPKRVGGGRKWSRKLVRCTILLSRYVKQHISQSPPLERSTRVGFEPTRAEHNGLAIHRLNHSATSSHNEKVLLNTFLKSCFWQNLTF